MENSQSFHFPTIKCQSEIQFPCLWVEGTLIKTYPIHMLRRYSIWEVVLYSSLPPVFLFPLSLDLFWRLKGLLYGSEMMSLQFSVSSIQFYDNDLLFTFPTWPFWKRNFSQHNSSLFFTSTLTSSKVTKEHHNDIRCCLFTCSSWEKICRIMAIFFLCVCIHLDIYFWWQLFKYCGKKKSFLTTYS